MAPPEPPNPIPTIELEGRKIAYQVCRVLPDTALVLRDVLREAKRLWIAQLGEDAYEEILSTAEGLTFFSGRVGLEPVPPEREMVAVWLPLPRGFRPHVRPQLIDYLEVVTEPRDAGKTGRSADRGSPGQQT